MFTGKYPFCVRCGTPFQVERHHIVFRSQGGTDDDSNLVSLCHDCHQKLHARQFVAWRKDDTVFLSEGGVIKQVRLLAYEGTQHELTDTATAVANWLEPENVTPLLKDAPNEVLQELYGALIRVRESAWQVQCLIVAELMERAKYGDHTAENVAAQLNMKTSTVYYRQRVAELLKDPEVREVGNVLTGETWYRIATQAEKPKEALLMAADRKAADPTYSTRQFQAESRGKAPHTISTIVLVCQKNETDRAIARALEREYGVSVQLQSVLEGALAKAV